MNEMSIPPELRRLRIIGAIFVGVIVIGVAGYMTVMGMTLDEALYMTVITISTVGFEEVVPLDAAGRWLTIGLIIGGVASVSYGAITAGEFVVEGHLGQYIERRRMQRAIEDLSEHVIICGFGRVGRHLSRSLDTEGVEYVLVEDDPGKIEELAELRLLAVSGDATAEHTLQEAGLDRARAVVACVNSDADNVLLTLTAKGLRPEVVVVARAKAEENESKLRRAGADRVILPSNIGARRIASLITRPVVAHFLEELGVGGADVTLDEVPVEPNGELDGIALRDTGIRERFGVTVLAVRRVVAGLDLHPSPELTLEGGDVLVVLGGEDDIHAIRRHFV